MGCSVAPQTGQGSPAFSSLASKAACPCKNKACTLRNPTAPAPPRRQPGCRCPQRPGTLYPAARFPRTRLYRRFPAQPFFPGSGLPFSLFPRRGQLGLVSYFCSSSVYPGLQGSRSFCSAANASSACRLWSASFRALRHSSPYCSAFSAMFCSRTSCLASAS